MTRWSGRYALLLVADLGQLSRNPFVGYRGTQFSDSHEGCDLLIGVAASNVPPLTATGLERWMCQSVELLSANLEKGQEASGLPVTPEALRSAKVTQGGLGGGEARDGQAVG
jgi:hypothetical protein